jgi:AraC-like DNA-binding protein
VAGVIPPTPGHAALNWASHVPAGQNADLLLRDQPVHAVAARRGFDDQAHSTRLFRSPYGITPSEYRRLAGRTGDRPTPGTPADAPGKVPGAVMS